jgi:hypothetical protein
MDKLQLLLHSGEIGRSAPWVYRRGPDRLAEPKLPAWQVALCTIGFGTATVLTLLWT